MLCVEGVVGIEGCRRKKKTGSKDILGLGLKGFGGSDNESVHLHHFGRNMIDNSNYFFTEFVTAYGGFACNAVRCLGM